MDPGDSACFILKGQGISCPAAAGTITSQKLCCIINYIDYVYRPVVQT